MGEWVLERIQGERCELRGKDSIKTVSKDGQRKVTSATSKGKRKSLVSGET